MSRLVMSGAVLLGIAVLCLDLAFGQTEVQFDTIGCSTNRTCYWTPASCNSSRTCTYIYSHRVVDNDTLEFEMAARVTGWVAVAFSTDNKMGDDDVLGCQADSSGVVHAKNMYNQGYTNILDDTSVPRVGLMNISTSLTNGVIACRFRRSINGTGSRDKNLHAAYTFFFGVHNTARAASNAPLTTQHNRLPTLSATKLSARSSGDVAGAKPSLGLITAHGILMLYAWIALSLNAMFYARYMRSIYRAPGWFYAHWITIGIAIITALSGAIVIGVHFGRFQSSAHSGIGVTVMVLTGIQLLAAAFRPAPDAENRPTFVMFHRSVGATTQILAFVALFLGLAEAEKISDIGKSPIAVLGGCVGVVALIIGYLEYRRKTMGAENLSAEKCQKGAGDGEGEEADGEKSETPAGDYATPRWLGYAFSGIVYGFTIGIASVLWGGKPL